MYLIKFGWSENCEPGHRGPKSRILFGTVNLSDDNLTAVTYRGNNSGTLNL